MCIKSGNRPDVEDIIENCPKEIINIMKQCWEANPEVRPTFAGKGIICVCTITQVVIFLMRGCQEVALSLQKTEFYL